MEKKENKQAADLGKRSPQPMDIGDIEWFENALSSFKMRIIGMGNEVEEEGEGGGKGISLTGRDAEALTLPLHTDFHVSHGTYLFRAGPAVGTTT